MKKVSAFLTFLILVGIFIPAVSAELLTETFTGSQEYTTAAGQDSMPRENIMKVATIQNFKNLDLIYLRADNLASSAKTTLTNNPYYEQHVKAKIDSTVIGEGTAYYNALWSGGKVSAVQMWIEFDSFDPGALTGTQTLTLTPDSGSLWNGIWLPYVSNSGSQPTTENPIIFLTASSPGRTISGMYIYRIEAQWFNEIYTDDNYITLNRIVDGNIYISNLTVIDQKGAYSDATTKDIKMVVFPPYTWTVETPYGKTFSGSVGTSDSPPTSTSATVYVRNSQTGALIANANIVISANVNGNFHEIVNETVPSAIYSIELQPTGGGMPNPDFYRLIVTVEGYNSIMPYIDFEVDGATTIYAYLDPTGGAPEDENKTFIDFYVRDLDANGISGATVNFGGYTLITNSAGYTIFEVDKNNTYSWTVSKSGYGSLTGNAVIGSDARHTINTVIAPAVTPTTPTAIPTSTSITPTSTMTAPTGEPTSNLLEWFAAHFGMLLGGGVEIGKIFMWLCFALPVGVYVGKEAKAGAAGFMAGAGVVTLFFVLIGWVPIWLLVLMALIIGLLYAKVFNNSDTGGGR